MTVTVRRAPTLPRLVELGRAGMDAGGPFIVALVIGGVVLAVTGRDAMQTYAMIVQQAFGGRTELANTLVSTTPILLTGLAAGLAFQAGVFNVGVEGSLYIGAFGAAWVGFTFVHLPAILLVPFAISLGGLAGALWACAPGLLRAYLRVDEVVTTLMLNYVAVLFTSYLVNYLFLAPQVANAMSPLVAAHARLPILLPHTQLTAGFLLALIITVLYGLFFRYMALGYELRMVGHNARFAAAAGIDTVLVILVAMVLSGLIGGIAGAIQILAVNGRFIDNFSPGYGFTGIAVALLGRNSPVGICLAALFFGALSNGGATVQLFTDIPIDLIELLQGIVMIFAVVQFRRFFAGRWRWACA